MNTYKIFILLIIFFSIISCSNKKEDIKIARVNDKYLYLSDLSEVYPDNLSKKDSIAFVKNFIDKWIKQAVFANKAELNLHDSLKNFELRLEEYKNSLLIYEYQKEYIKQNLDTNISETDIDNYYNKNKEQFILHNSILKVDYAKIKKDAPEIYNVWFWYTSNSSNIRKLYKEYCNKYSEEFSFSDDWVTFYDLQKLIPFKVSNQEQFLKSRKYFDAKDNKYFYFVRIKTYELPNQVMPISLAKEEVKAMFINKKKLQLLEKMEIDLMKKSKSNNEYEIYNITLKN